MCLVINLFAEQVDTTIWWERLIEEVHIGLWEATLVELQGELNELPTAKQVADLQKQVKILQVYKWSKCWLLTWVLCLFL
jgi:hypothetical protein